jgi:cytochrome d ubiquinol oxidase subunit II
LYASGFSGFYLALTIVLWLLMLRGISIEFRSHIQSELWCGFWDVVFFGSSALLAIFYGAALGNVVRGVPIDKEGFFFIPLWTNLRTGAAPGIIDWYTVMVGVAALLVLTVHGATWVALKTSDPVQSRARMIASRVYWAVCLLVLAISAASFSIQPKLAASYSERPLTWIFPLIAIAALIALRLFLNARLDLGAFFSSAVFIATMLCSVVFGLYPDVLPAVPDAGRSLTIFNVAASGYGLRVGFFWWIPAFLLALGYSFFVYRHFSGKVQVPEKE